MLCIARVKIPTDLELQIKTARLDLEPVLESHARELTDLFADPELHRYVDFQVPTYEVQLARCIRWSRRQSPTGDELWLNWAARHRGSQLIIGHFQVGLRVGSPRASIGYMVARSYQNQGLAREALEPVIEFLADSLGVAEIFAEIDPHNEASIRLVERLGLSRSALAPANGADVVYAMPLSRLSVSRTQRTQ